MGRMAVLTVAAMTLALGTGCKSKLEKCQDVCRKIEAEHIAKCGGGADCVSEQKETTGACMDLCETISTTPEERRAKAAKKAESAESDCEAGKAEACRDAGGQYLLGRGGKPKDDAKALPFFEKACTLGLAEGCEYAGKMHRDGRGAARDAARGMEYLTKACDAGAPGACTSVGLDAQKQGDNARALTLMTKACNGNDGLGCTGLGAMYLHGNGVKKDPAKAREYLTKACKLKVESACKVVGTAR